MLKHMRNLLGGALLAIALGIPYLQAADVAISALPAGAALTGTEAIPAVQSAATVKTTPAAIKTYIETGGTVTASDPVIDASQTWNNAAVAFTAWRVNITDTASAAASILGDWQIGGNSRIRFGKNSLSVSGTDQSTTFLKMTHAGVSNATIDFKGLDGTTSRIYTEGAGTWLFDNGSNLGGLYIGGAAGTRVNSTAYFGWTNSNAYNGTLDLALYRDAANTLAQRNDTAAQTFRVYNTYTDASNYERLAINAGAEGDWLQLAAETGGTGVDNIGIALTPAGTGAISAQVPDSGTAGGNARGANAVDLQTLRTANTQVASGAQSSIGGGYGNRASGQYARVGGGVSNIASQTATTVAGGTNVVASGYGATGCGGDSNTASGHRSVVSGGWYNTASGDNSWVPGGLYGTTRGLSGAYAYAAGQRSAQGDAQVIGQPVRRTTTDATPVSLATDGTPAATTIMIVPGEAVMMCTALVVAKPASAITDGVGFDIEGLVYRSGSTTALLSIPNSTVHGSNTLALAATFVANDTLEGLEIQVTGAAATTIYWAGELKCVQVL